MTNILLSIFFVLVIIYIIPILVYGIFSSIAGVKPPKGSPVKFLVSVLISKVGTAISFVLLFLFAGSALHENWPLYALLWWMMFIIGEIGQALGPGYTWKEAIAGMISETIYVPLSAFIIYLFV